VCHMRLQQCIMCVMLGNEEEDTCVPYETTTVHNVCNDRE
jgi:hypothetical protein